MPLFMGNTGQLGVPNVARAMPVVRNFQDGFAPSFEYPYQIIGVTRDQTGAALAGCLVELFRTADNSYVSSVTSDASGNYVIPASQLFAHYVVAYLPGSPDRAGTSVNTIVGS